MKTYEFTQHLFDIDPPTAYHIFRPGNNDREIIAAPDDNSRFYCDLALDSSVVVLEYLQEEKRRYVLMIPITLVSWTHTNACTVNSYGKNNFNYFFDVFEKVKGFATNLRLTEMEVYLYFVHGCSLRLKNIWFGKDWNYSAFSEKIREFFLELQEYISKPENANTLFYFYKTFINDDGLVIATLHHARNMNIADMSCPLKFVRFGRDSYYCFFEELEQEGYFSLVEFFMHNNIVITQTNYNETWNLWTFLDRTYVNQIIFSFLRNKFNIKSFYRFLLNTYGESVIPLDVDDPVDFVYLDNVVNFTLNFDVALPLPPATPKGVHTAM
ncbi:MAG: hypothetical protein N3A54_01275 [Patescibacteria group bacterium]|nr:hypothetical protein [Patescibacteria group bacterium]